jgi:hypothetical protein
MLLVLSLDLVFYVPRSRPVISESGNWSWQRQDSWKYIEASFPPIENSIKSSGQNHRIH